VFQGVVREGWSNLLELVLLSVVWFFFMLSVAAGLLAPEAVKKGAGLLIGAAMFALPIFLVGPASIGLFRAVDAIWSGESAGPFDALRNFFRGFGHRYLRGVGLSAVWTLVLLATYANLIEDRHLVPTLFIVGIDVLLLYVVLFVVMVNVYLISILATTEFGLIAAIRVAAWEAVANPVFTLVMIFAPGVVVAFALAVRPLLPLLVGAALSLFGTAALRYAPYRHPVLPPPVDLRAPMEEGGQGG
jgi:uncharacterized membrane protein YesL